LGIFSVIRRQWPLFAHSCHCIAISEGPESTHPSHLPLRRTAEDLDLHRQRCGDARKAIREGGDQRAVAQIAHGLERNAVDQPPPFVAFQHRRLADLDDVLGAADGRGQEAQAPACASR
jgi:hypothetical protein